MPGTRLPLNEQIHQKCHKCPFVFTCGVWSEEFFICFGCATFIAGGQAVQCTYAAFRSVSGSHSYGYTCDRHPPVEDTFQGIDVPG